MNPLISLIVPVYNVENYLEKCLNSIRNQSYKNIQVIIINDGSNDNSCNIIDKYVNLDTRFQKVYQNNSGVGEARNNGILISKGQYIMFIDSDDYLHENFIQDLYNNIEKNKADIAVCDYYAVFESNKIIKYEKNWICNKNILNDKEEIMKLFLLNNMAIVPWNKLYKKSLFEFEKKPFPSNLKNEDIEGIFKIFYCAEKVSYVNKGLYYYLQRENSATKTYDNSIFDMFTVLDNVKNYLINRNEYTKYKEELDYLFLYYGIIITFKRAMNMKSNEIKNATKKIQNILKEQPFNVIECNKYLKLKQKIVLVIIYTNVFLARKIFKCFNR